VAGDAKVSQCSTVSGDAVVAGRAEVYGDSKVSGDAHVSGKAKIRGHGKVRGEAHVSGDAVVSDYAVVSGQARVKGHAKVWGTGEALGTVKLSGDATINSDRRATEGSLSREDQGAGYLTWADVDSLRGGDIVWWKGRPATKDGDPAIGGRYVTVESTRARGLAWDSNFVVQERDGESIECPPADFAYAAPDVEF
jgi:cytoskeletal protein CcmA (bactofilin family)